MSDESKEQSTEPRQVKIEYVVPDPESGLFTTYANNTQVGWTHFDVRMTFGEVVDALPDKIVVEQRAQITISYLQAKILTLILGQAISQHEEIFGELKLPPDVTIQVSSAQGSPAPGTSFRT